jgi:hypothetical protein
MTSHMHINMHIDIFGSLIDRHCYVTRARMINEYVAAGSQTNHKRYTTGTHNIHYQVTNLSQQLHKRVTTNSLPEHDCSITVMTTFTLLLSLLSVLQFHYCWVVTG